MERIAVYIINRDYVKERQIRFETFEIEYGENGEDKVG